MISKNSEMEWTELLNKWNGVIFKLYNFQQASSELIEKVPQPWIDLLELPNQDSIKNIWNYAIKSLPKFISYLSWAILDARIAESNAGFLLVYKLKDWNEEINHYGDNKIFYEDSNIIAGYPVTESLIAQYESDIGVLPPALRDLWSIHGFIELRDQNLIFSIDSLQQKLSGSPILFTSLKDDYRDGQLSDCLGIAEVNGETIASISRQTGSTIWNDHIVNVDRKTKTTYDTSNARLDDMLSNYLFNEWQLPDLSI